MQHACTETSDTAKTRATASLPVACLICTTQGQILYCLENNLSVPINYSKLGLLLASFFQFSGQEQSYCSLVLRNGYQAIASYNSAEMIAVIMILRSEREENKTQASARIARLKGIVILHAFLSVFKPHLPQLIEQYQKKMNDMLKKYTLSNALKDTNVLPSYFLEDNRNPSTILMKDFQVNFLRPILKQTEVRALECFSAYHQQCCTQAHTMVDCVNGLKSQGTEQGPKIDICRGFVLNAESKDVLYSQRMDIDDSCRSSGKAIDFIKRCCYSQNIEQICLDAADALHSVFTVIQEPTVLHILSSVENEQRFFVALQMFKGGSITAAVYFHAPPSSYTLDQNNEVQQELIRRLMQSSISCSKFFSLLRHSDNNNNYRIHFGSNILPSVVLQALDSLMCPWENGTCKHLLEHNARNNNEDTQLHENCEGRIVSSGIDNSVTKLICSNPQKLECSREPQETTSEK